MQKLKTNFNNGDPIVASMWNLTNKTINEVSALVEVLNKTVSTITETSNTEEVLATMDSIKEFLDKFSSSTDLASVLYELETNMKEWVEQKTKRDTVYLTQDQYDELDALGQLEDDVEYNIYDDE